MTARAAVARALAGLCGVLLAGCAGAGPGVPPPAAPAPVAAPASALPTGPAPLPVGDEVTATSLEIPAIGLAASRLEPLGLLPDGSLAAPAGWQDVGIYADGPVPGERGPAVVAGHVDSVSGPAVFYRLRSLRPGDRITVGRSDGRVVGFEVDRVVSVSKDRFPTELVYGPTPDAQLRLITCGGDFDRAVHSYRDNTVVLATATA